VGRAKAKPAIVINFKGLVGFAPLYPPYKYLSTFPNCSLVSQRSTHYAIIPVSTRIIRITIKRIVSDKSISQSSFAPAALLEGLSQCSE